MNHEPREPDRLLLLEAIEVIRSVGPSSERGKRIHDLMCLYSEACRKSQPADDRPQVVDRAREWGMKADKRWHDLAKAIDYCRHAGPCVAEACCE